MDTIITDDVSNFEIDDERLILYAIGDLTPEEMADIDVYAFAHPETNRKLEFLLEIVDLIETSPEIQVAMSNPDKLSDFLAFLSSFGKKLWPWRQDAGKEDSVIENIKNYFHEWEMKRDAGKLALQFETRRQIEQRHKNDLHLMAEMLRKKELRQEKPFRQEEPHRQEETHRQDERSVLPPDRRTGRS